MKEFIAFIDKRYGGSLAAMLAMPKLQLGEELLAVKGIGPQTADSILLYAGHHAIFVVDRYISPVLERHDAIHPKSTYDEIRGLVEDALRTTEPRGIDDSVVLDPGRPAVHEPSAMSSAAKSQLAPTYNEMHGCLCNWGSTTARCRIPSARFVGWADTEAWPDEIAGIMRP